MVDGEPVELEDHLGRLSASLQALFPDRRRPQGLVHKIDSAAADTAHSGLRVTVAPDSGDAFDIAIEAAATEPGRILPPEPPTVDAHSLVVRGGLGGHKWADRRLLDAAQAELAGDALPLIFDWDGTVLEASRANVFAAFGRTLVTPPADGRILPGIARARTLEVAVEAGFEVREATLRREDLAAADEVLLTGSLRGVERVRALDGVALNGAGEAAPLIHAALRRAWAGAGLDRVARR